jgi:peptidoglycan hydrolase-like protein with peptidoglycan-binding domain
MAETAVGLFEHPGTADAVADALRANGIPSNGIRILAKPPAQSVDSATSTPTIDFAAALAQDLRSMGATDRECEAYLAGVRQGNVLVFATGSSAQAETAISVMNAYEPIEIEEFAGAVPAAVGVQGKEVAPHDSISLGSDQARAKTEGARVFSW